MGGFYLSVHMFVVQIKIRRITQRIKVNPSKLNTSFFLRVLLYMGSLSSRKLDDYLKYLNNYLLIVKIKATPLPPLSRKQNKKQIPF